MRRINMQTYPRREHFKVFSAFDQPHFNMCANVDLSTFYPAVKRRGFSFTVALVYVISRASNDIPEFRQRIREGEVIEHEIVHPSGTILVDEDLFSFCTFDYYEDFSEFAPRAAEMIAQVKENLTLKDEPGRDDLLFMTAIPWVSFTSFMHPLHLSPADSVPRFAWGKIFEDGEILKMPLSVQGHHALMDGIHVARYYENVQDYFDHPDITLGEG
ncbi:MAG: chloramphenicol acetyltransferase [Anaerolineae bacterium SM23_ 63]|nr:MAG: chloramphenicol acetyltransferase [Anaerolineae bacterium SM23_ 63]